jgi:hypothetical protein
MIDQELLTAFFEHPAGRAAVQQQRAKQLAKRQGLVAELEAIRQRRDKETPPLRAVEAKARQKVDEAKEALKAAEDELSSARRKLWSVTNSLSGQEKKLCGELQATADPMIDEFIEEMQQDTDATRQIPLTSNVDAGERNMVGRLFRGKVYSNKPAILARLAAATAAIEAAQDLKLVATTHEEIDKRLQLLRAGLPMVRTAFVCKMEAE